MRCAFSAVFIKFGKYTKPSGNEKHYMLIFDVRDARGRLMTDHVWMPLTAEDPVSRMRLRSGEVISFTAMVNTYSKGTRRRRYFDYGLVQPRDVVRVAIEQDKVYDTQE
jgi:hypothetical protein